MNITSLDTFGKRLKYALKVRDVTQSELGGAIGLKQQAIFLLCKEKSKGTKHSFPIARYLRVDPEWLILGTGHAPSSVDSPDSEAQDDLFAYGLLTSQEREVLANFRCLTKAQREDEIRHIQKTALLNKEVVVELGKELGKDSGKR